MSVLSYEEASILYRTAKLLKRYDSAHRLSVENDLTGLRLEERGHGGWIVLSKHPHTVETHTNWAKFAKAYGLVA